MSEETTILDETTNHQEDQTKNYYAELAAIDVSKFMDKKNGFSYVSWPHAQNLLKLKHPNAHIEVIEYPDYELNNMMMPYRRTPFGFFVYVAVTVNGNTVCDPFPVTDYRNKPIMQPTVMDINTSLQRAKVKSIAGHGLGINVYAGEDLPLSDEQGELHALTKPPGNNPPAGNKSKQTAPPSQPALGTEAQFNELKAIANQISVLEFGMGEDKKHLRDARFKELILASAVTKESPAELVAIKINEMKGFLQQVHAKRSTPAAPPPEDLSAVL